MGHVELELPWGQTLRGVRWQGAGAPLLLLHEPGADLDAWSALPALLATTLGCDVFAYDLPGHGLSDDPWEPERLPMLVTHASQHVAAGHRLSIVAAGQGATTALRLAPALPLLGLICLSPDEPGTPPPRSPTVPKLFFASALAGDDLARARRLASDCGGWSLVTSIPSQARGTALLDDEWRGRMTEQMLGFLRDCLHGRSIFHQPHGARNM